MKKWFSDGVFRAVLRNAGYLGSTKLIGAGLGLIALASAGRGLGPHLFGVLMIVHTYATGTGSLVKFQSWQMILRYGGPALRLGDVPRAKDAIRFAFGLDIASGLVGMALAMLALPVLAKTFQIPPEYFWLALIYCTLVPTMSAATPTGVLRLLDRFDLLAAQQLATPILRASGAGAAYLSGTGFTGFVIAWYVADLAGDLILWAMAVRELRRRDMLDALRPGLRAPARRLPDSWSFAWTTNIAISLDASWGQLSNLVVAGILGPTAAGLYKIANTLIDTAGKPANLMTKGFYPEIMRLDPASKQPWRLALRTGIFAALMGIAVVAVVVLGGRPVIGFAFGAKYLPAYGLLSAMVVALVVAMAAFPLESLLYMVGRQRAALVAQAAGTALYLTTLTVLCHRFGLPGAGAAFIIGTVTLALFRLVPVLSSYRDRHLHAWPAGGNPAPGV